MGMVADVFDCLLISGNNVVGTTTLQAADIAVAMESADVRAGQGNSLKAIIHSTRDINISLTDVEWRLEYLAMHLGQEIVTQGAEDDAFIAYHMPIWLTAEESGMDVVINLPEEVAEDGEGDPIFLKVYDEDGVEVVATHVTDVVTLTGVDEGDQVRVMFAYETDEGTEKIDIEEGKWPSDLMCVLETLEIDDDEQVIANLQYKFFRAKPSGDITVATTSERSAATQEMNLRVLKPKTSNIVGEILRLKTPEPEGE